MPVIKSPDRVKGALFAHVHLGSEIVILDDGFQHRRLHRDLDIVLVSRDVTRERLLPEGPLREPSSSLARARFVIAMKGAPYPGLHADLRPDCLVDALGEATSTDILAGENGPGILCHRKALPLLRHGERTRVGGGTDPLQ